MKLASIEVIQEVNAHPNADKLDIVSVLGYKCVVGKDQFKAGEQVVLIQPDTVLPDAPWAEMFKKKSSRVKAIKLRNEWSFGIVMPISELLDQGFYSIGEEVSEQIGVTKYEPPMPQHLDAAGNLPTGLPKTDEERWQNISDLPFGEKVDITLKIDGSSATYYCRKNKITHEWETGICTRSMRLKPECDNNYTKVEKKHDILRKLKDYCVEHDVSLALRGEVYGQGIQAHSSNPHSKLPLNFAAFSIYNFDKHEYEAPFGDHYYQNVCKILNIPTVPTIMSNVVLTKELISDFAQGIEKIDGNLFEGVVIKHQKGSFKVINLAYDEKK